MPVGISRVPNKYYSLSKRMPTEEALKVAFRLIDKTVSDGIQHKNTAARQKGELQRLVNSIK